MDVFMTVFRLLHIVGGAFWAGSVIMMGFFLLPAVAAAGPAGGDVLRKLTGATKFMPAMAHAGIWTILSGVALYWKDSNGFDPEWLLSATGMIFTAGAIAGIAAVAVGAAAIRPAVVRMQELDGAAGPAPSAERQAAMTALQAQLGGASKSQAALAVASLVAMAAARHVYF